MFLRPVALAALLIAAATAPASAADDPVVAQRGADKITMSQAKAALAALDPVERQKISTTPALTQFIRDALLQRGVLEAAQAAHWEQKPEVQALLARARQAAIAQSFLQAQAAIPLGYPPEADIQSAYDSNKSAFMQPRGYHIDQAFLPVGGDSGDAVKRRMADLRSKLVHNRQGIEGAAKLMPQVQYTDLGWVPENQLSPDMKSLVGGLPEGGMSEVACSQTGCHLFRLVATRSAGPAPLADMRDTLIKALRQRKIAEGEKAFGNRLVAAQPIQVDEIQLAHVLGQ